jgi:glutathione S-transferase
MYALYIANKNYSSWSLRPWLLMQRLGIPFQERMVPFAPGSNWAQFRRFSPTGRVPCLRDEALYVWDSLAITEYLAERHSGVWPRDGKPRAWARCAAAEMHSGFNALRECCPMNCGIRVSLRELSVPLKNDIARIDELWSEGLASFGGPFLTGEQFTAVDAFFAPVAYRIQTYGLSMGREAQAYAERLLELPEMKLWYGAAIVEPWRELGHEEEILRNGSLVKDYRIGGFA